VSDRAGEPFDVVVLGAGPAGVAAALETARLGYRTAIVTRPRSPTVEGLSARAFARLIDIGFERVARCASAPAARFAYWAGNRSVRGQESIVEREDFDMQLRAGLAGTPVRWIDAAVRRVRLESQVWQVETSSGVLRGRAVLDARGRRARRCDQRGPLLVAWNALCQTDERSAPGSAVVALDDGWCWFARTGDGLLSLQFVGTAAEHASCQAFAARIQAATRALPEFGLTSDRVSTLEATGARAAVARYSRPSRGPGYLRIGDAAVAMDPLSGNGIYEALRSARVCAAAINSYLRGAEWAVLARFVDEQARELWRRSVAAAGNFYRLQAAHTRSEFWTLAASAYEKAAREATVAERGPGRFEMRPVLDGQRIEVRRVWVSSDWPRGVWKVNGRTLDQMPPELVPSVVLRAASDSHHEV
jgi:flavin-dependent dehydrogenase